MGRVMVFRRSVLIRIIHIGFMGVVVVVDDGQLAQTNDDDVIEVWIYRNGGRLYLSSYSTRHFQAFT